MFSITIHRGYLEAIAITILLLGLSFIPNASDVMAFQNGPVTVDDGIVGTEAQQFNYVGKNWKHCTTCGQIVAAFNDSNSWDATANEYVTVAFQGTQIQLYGVTGPANGIGAVSIDDGAEANVDFYAADAAGDELLWTSANLAPAPHTLKIRVTGTHNPASTGNFISLDRVDIYEQGTAVPTETPSAGDATTKMLPFGVVDADYSASLDRLIMISTDPDALHIFNPLTGKDVTVKLPRRPINVSVSLDGKSAAVAHDALISYVNLQKAVVIKTFEVPYVPTAIVLASNGWIYSMGQGQSAQLEMIQISTGLQEQAKDIGFYEEVDIKLEADGKRIYGASTGLSPGYIQVIDISKDKPKNLGERQIEGMYPCGKLWMSQDSKRLFTGLGMVYRTSADPKQDTAYNGRLTGMKYVGYVFHSNKAGMILALPDPHPVPPCPNQGEEVADRMLIFDYQTLGLLKTIQMPVLGTGANAFPSTGHFVFVNAAGTTYYLVVQAAGQSALLDDWAVALGDLKSIR